MQEEGSSLYKNSDYKDYQRSSDIIRAVGIVRPQIEKLLYEGKIEIFPDRAMRENIDIREVNEKIRISIRHDLKFEEAMMAIINAIDTHDQFRDVFQGDIKPLRQSTSDIEALYQDAEPARQELHHFIKEFAAQTDARNTLLPCSLSFSCPSQRESWPRDLELWLLESNNTYRLLGPFHWGKSWRLFLEEDAEAFE
jgi:hypothetical protein